MLLGDAGYKVLRIENPRVSGSIPPLATFNALIGLVFFCLATRARFLIAIRFHLVSKDQACEPIAKQISFARKHYGTNYGASGSGA